MAFADGFPFLLISQASVDDTQPSPRNPVPADRFRANIIIDGCAPHAEDDWTRITIGEVGFRVAKPCARCGVITTDQHDGTRSTEPLSTLAEYRKIDGKVLFGQNLVHEDGVSSASATRSDAAHPADDPPLGALVDDPI